jgi:hypothetical protein
MRRLLLFALPFILVAPAPADPLQNAYFLCDLFEKTAVSTDCTVSSAAATVDVVVAATPAEAVNICTVITSQMAEKRRAFGGRWQLRIFPPEGGADPTAACRLR